MGFDTKQCQAIAVAFRFDLGKVVFVSFGCSVFIFFVDFFDVCYYIFGQDLNLVGDATAVDGTDLANIQADAPGTSIAASLEAVASSGGLPPAGIVLLSDGIDNASSQRSEAVLNDLGARGIPVYTVDGGLYIGEVPEIDGLWVLAGDSESGITHGPGMGKLVAQLIVGEEPFTDPAPFRLDRVDPAAYPDEASMVAAMAEDSIADAANRT